MKKVRKLCACCRRLLGKTGFKRGLDLYFARHDGQAVTCDDFRAAMADANIRDLTQFENWYSQAGTPRVKATAHYDAAAATYTLKLEQFCAPTPDQANKKPFLIPFAVGLLDEHGVDMPLKLDGEYNFSAPTDTLVLELKEASQEFVFTGITKNPVPSLLRNFSAPINLEFDYRDEELAFLLAHDSDAFNRWEAGSAFSNTPFTLR
jgi:aminopeptidase N